LNISATPAAVTNAESSHVEKPPQVGVLARMTAAEDNDGTLRAAHTATTDINLFIVYSPPLADTCRVDATP
jgi:hypothetical protein